MNFFLIHLFIYFWLCWVFVSLRGLSLVAVSGGHPSSRCTGLSLSRPLLLRSTGSRRASSVVVAHGPSCSVTCGIFPDQGSNPCPLHWQADSQPLRHQGSPIWVYLICISIITGDEQFFMFLFSICTSTLMKCLFKFSVHFLISFVFPYFCVLRIFVYSTWKSFIRWFAIFSLSLCLIF